MDIQSIKKNSAVIAAGQWVDSIPGLEDAALRVRGLTCPAARAFRAKKERAAPDSDREADGMLNTEALRRILCETLLEVVLIDWKGLTSDGKPLAYARETAEQFLLDPDFEEFADWVTWAAHNVDRNNTGVQAALEKNSEAPSSGA
jgi:hypothetical protein